jgi:hypothetical protein
LPTNYPKYVAMGEGEVNFIRNHEQNPSFCKQDVLRRGGGGGGGHPLAMAMFLTLKAAE